ncbi:MAG: PAS domain-containing protein [Rhodoferax sp.]|nr:PAS domain-containing protein [Rhodoferax sp.]
MPGKTQPAHLWLGPSATGVASEASEDSSEFVRLWQGFMTARLTLGAVLVTLQITLLALSVSQNKALVAISLAYFASAMLARIYARPRPLGNAFDTAWLSLVGLDVLAFLSLQALQGSSINYTPLCVLPILLTSVLGTLRLALGTAAGITMLLLGGTLWAYLESPGDAAPYLAQSALSGAGYFVIALLANQLASRLASEGLRARTNQHAARIQRQVNELVIESLPDGVLIVDDKGCVLAANPSARKLLGTERAREASAFYLREEPGWQSLLHLTQLSMEIGQSCEEEVSIRHEGRGVSRVCARTRLAEPQGSDGESLCVLFLQDQREMEARMRTEKLASMGRMSTAVAHEIRNPLAAISQANALLEEDLTDPRLKRLTQMVSQNTKRLDRIVEDILKVSRIAPDEQQPSAVSLLLHESSQAICRDWSAQTGRSCRLEVHAPTAPLSVRFDADHLRRVLVNLLDNARRYASVDADAIQIWIGASDAQHATLSAWSNGAPMDQSVERHLFEPFFSSESRSSGLGLYICRELCERHGASMVYQRSARPCAQGMQEGNEFVISFLRADGQQPSLLEKVSAIL